MVAAWTGCSLLLAVVAAGSLQAQAKPATLRLVDDRGKAIAAPLEVCFQIATRRDCVAGREGAYPVPAEFVSVRVEGPDHGPASVPRQGLKSGPDGDLLLTVPRKALLQISAKSAERLTVSLYRQDDPTFRAPSFRAETRGGASLEIPSGDHVVSLASPGRAPDLHLLSAKPGGNERLDYRPRSGWSLVVRSRAEKDGNAVAGAQVTLGGMEGFSAKLPEQRQVSGKSGLALFSGLAYVLASAGIEHPRFVLHREEGITASPGTFAFREASLEEGGRLRAAVTSEGKPLSGIDCRVLEYDANPSGKAPEPKVHFQAATDASGICRSSPLAPGPYTLRLAKRGQRSFLDRSVVVANGEETALAVPIVSIRVHGTVQRGSQPAPSYAVTFSDLAEIKPSATRRDAQAEAATNEEGEYEAVLWSSGDYDFMVRTPAGTPAGHRTLHLESPEERADFSLQDHDVAGVVMDDHDRPVPDATVFLSWNQTHRLARTDSAGSFSFPLGEDGKGTVQVRKPGYLEPALVEVEAHPDAYPPPLVIRLKRSGLLAGTLQSAAGPASGASLFSYRLEPGGRMTPLGITAADGEGKFELAAADGATTRVFATGAGCPLTPFDLAPASALASDAPVLHCADAPASLELHFADPQGKPLAGKTVFARKDGVVIPDEVLTLHLNGLHLPAATDGGGRLLLVGLAPGNYEIYLAESTNPEVIASGQPNGFLNASILAPLTSTELEITLESGRN